MGTITDTRGYLEDPYLTGGYLAEAVTFTELCQVNMIINGFSAPTNSQVNALVNDFEHARNSQVNMVSDDFVDSRNSEVKDSTPFIHALCQNYLEGGYLEEPYLAGIYCVSARSQVTMLTNDFLDTRNSQVLMRIDDFLDPRNSQVNMRIDDFLKTENSEVLTVIIQAENSQVILNLYNTTRPRILCEFPSRGLSGLNWTASSQEPGDFDVNNLNSDIEELVFRTATGTVSGLSLVCDAEQEVFLDTFAMLNHNLTTSATVTLQGSNNIGFAPVVFEENLLVETDRIFFVSPTLPLTSHRYWRLLISDPTTTANFLEIGIVIFGSSRIMGEECTTDNITITKRHFKNEFRTEGFTSASNDRALRKSMRFEFRQIAFDTGDFTLLDDVMDFARTSLKCLWILDPSTASLITRFHAFGKIKDMPSQRHEVRGKAERLDLITFSLEVDESE